MDYPQISPWLMLVVVAIGLISIVLKAIALWRSARLGQKWWFALLLILNTAGILPIIYLVLTTNRNTVKKKS